MFLIQNDSVGGGITASVDNSGGAGAGAAASPGVPGGGSLAQTGTQTNA